MHEDRAAPVAIVGLAACFVVGSLMSLRREPVARAAAPSDPQTRVPVEGASHDVHIDAPDALVAAIEDFEAATGSRPSPSR